MATTQNLHLPQFEGSDRIHHEDFNEAFRKIDAGIPHLVTGRFTGTGYCGRGNENHLTFDFEPQFVIVHPLTTGFGMIAIRPTARAVSLCVTGLDRTYGNYLTWQNNSLLWYSDGNADRQCNVSNAEYIYYAIGF